MDDVSDQQRVREKIVARRAEAMQRALDEAQENLARAALCNDNRQFKATVPGLEGTIKALEFTNPALYSYVRKMEMAEFTRVCSGAIDEAVVSAPTRCDASAPSDTSECQRGVIAYDIKDSIEGLADVARSLRATITALEKTHAGLTAGKRARPS